MPALITVHYGNGESRRCDANCYDAKAPDCHCICGGANHGVGFQRAAENVVKSADELIKKYEGNAAYVVVDREASGFLQGELL
jgi:hypothetical protein